MPGDPFPDRPIKDPDWVDIVSRTGRFVSDATARELCASHEQLRRLVRELIEAHDTEIEQLNAEHEALRADLAAMTAVAQRYFDGWSRTPSGKWWTFYDDLPDDEPITDAERRTLDALEADDAG